MRAFLNLCGLNKFIKYMRFRIVTLSAILPMLSQNDWFAALDHQDAYFQMVILLGLRKFPHFVVGEHHFQCTVLPFGLSSAH